HIDFTCRCAPVLDTLTFNNTATHTIYSHSLHDALPIFANGATFNNDGTFVVKNNAPFIYNGGALGTFNNAGTFTRNTGTGTFARSEEHTSELQSRENVVCGLLLVKEGDGGSTTGEFNVA